MEYKKIGDLTNVITGGTPPTAKPEYWDNGDIPWLQSGCCQDCDVDFAEKYITQEGYDNSSTKLMPKDSVMIALTGATAGKIGYLNFEACGNQSITGILPCGLMNQRYLFYFLLSQREKILADCIGGAQPHISQGYVKNIYVPVLSLEKQKEIVDTLSCLSGIINKRRDEIRLLDNFIKARFVEMFGSIHDGKFEMKTLPEIVRNDKNSIKRGPFGGALKKDDFVDEGYLVYEQRHAIHNDFDYAKYYITQEKYEDMIGFKVVPGDLIISCSGVTLGRIAEVPNGAKAGIINQALLKLSLNQELMMNTFFIQQFRGEEIQEILFGFSRGSGIPNMPSMSEVKAVKFVCPPLEMQKQYCDFVHQVDKSKVAVQKALEKTQLLFDSLMQQYFG